MSKDNELSEEEKCLACDLVLEFKQMCDEDVHWESALRHVLHVALEIKDEIIEDQYTLGFEDGIQTGTRKAAKLMNELVEFTDEEILAYHAEREADINSESEAEEEIEDISDEEYDKIAKLIRETKELS